MVTQTSINSYHEDIKDKKEITQENKVLIALDCLTDATANKISRITKIPVHLVCARLNRLLKNKKVYKTEKTVIDRISQKANEVWEKCTEKD